MPTHQRSTSTGGRGGNAFLLAQLGAYAAARFADRVAPLNFTPPQVGLLRLIATTPGQSQRAIARQLGTPPSRLVTLVDGLEDRGLVERRKNPDDRRNYALYLTDAGEAAMKDVATVARAHEDAICAPLEAAEREQLRTLLARIATEHDLTPGVHPGYRHLADKHADKYGAERAR